MQNLNARRVLVAAALAASLALAPAMAQAAPDATISIHGGSAGFIIGGSGGSGVLHFHGSHRLKIGGLGVGTIGVSSFDASGEVYGLHHVSDIEGTYAAINVEATAGSGAGELDMKNGNGVEIRAHVSTSGLKLSVAPNGMTISLSH